jgi:hypothetical protein
MDLKWENFAVTWKQRVADGGEVFVLDPFRITGDHTYHAYERRDAGSSSPTS